MEFIFFLSFILLCAAENDVSADKTKRILVEDNFYTLVAKFNALEQEVASFKAQSSEIAKLRNTVAKQNDTINQLKQKFTDLQVSQATHSHETVAFMAYLTKSVTGTNHHIYFDDVKLNLGNGYNPHHGTFVVPVNGTYLFTVTACSYGGHFVVLEITVNNSNLGKTRAGDNVYHECTSNVFLAQLKTGDDVFVQHVNQGDYLYSTTNFYPSFTGVLLQAD